MSSFSKVARDKVQNKHTKIISISKKEITKKNSTYTNIKRIKHVGINHVKDLYSESQETLLKEIKEEMYPMATFRLPAKMPMLPKQSTDSM